MAEVKSDRSVASSIEFHRAIEIAAAQSSVPLSPAGVDKTGRLTLCAAACLAMAGLEIRRSMSHGTAFAFALAKTGSKNKVRMAYRDLGWDHSLCVSLMTANDAAPADRRKNIVLKALAELDVQLGQGPIRSNAA